jgi:hypothetical protein
MCECFFFPSDRYSLVIVGVTAVDVVRGEFGFVECFEGILFFVICVVLCIVVVRFRPLFLGDPITVCCSISVLLPPTVSVGGR